MVGGDDGDIVRPQRGGEVRQALVERLERGGISRDVAAVAVERVEINEIRQHQRARALRARRIDRGLEHGRVAIGLDLRASAAMREDMADLANRDDGAGGGTAKSRRWPVWVGTWRADERPGVPWYLDEPKVEEALEPEMLEAAGDKRRGA